MMTKDEANIIATIPDMHWNTLVDVIERDKETIRRMLQDPGNARDTDMLHKGALGFIEQVLGYKEMALKIIHPPKED